MKTVTYTSSYLLSCASCGGSVVLCVSDELIASGKSFIDAVVASTQETWTSCGALEYIYGFTYDEDLLVDPSYSLVSSDIEGVFCRGCMTSYIDSQVLILKGTSAERPVFSSSDIGRMYMDTDLDVDGLPIWWNGVKWIKADGSDA